MRHHILLEKVAQRVTDDEVLHLLRLILKACGKRGVPQGGVISPLLSNVYLNEVDKMLERAESSHRAPEMDGAGVLSFCRRSGGAGERPSATVLAARCGRQTASRGVCEAWLGSERGEEPDGGSGQR